MVATVYALEKLRCNLCGDLFTADPPSGVGAVRYHATAGAMIRKAPKVVVSLDVTNLSAPALHQEVLELRRRVKKLTAFLRLALVLLRCSGFELTHERLPDGRAKIRILCAVDLAREYAVAGGPAVPAIVAESVQCLATAAARVCA
jgi:hypothetical protein